MPSLPRFFRRPLSAATLLLSPVLFVVPQVGLALSPPNRIAAVDGATRGTIAHNVAGRTKAATDLGQAPSDRRLEGVTLFFSRTAAQQAALDQLMVAQQTPGSPQYHKWLTPTQFGEQFGLSASDMAKVKSWLTSQGLTISYTAPSSSLITVGGTVAQMQQAFGTTMHLLSSRGEQHIANTTDPVLPAAIANVISGIGGLNDFKPVSHARPHVVSAKEATAAFTSGVSGLHFLSPGDFHTIYDSQPLLSAAINGTGATIAIMGQTDISLPEVAAFRAAGGLPAQVPTIITATAADPGSQPTDIPEAQLDVEWAGASAPNATILFVNSSQNAMGAFTSLEYAITQASAPILSISYGNCEPALDAAFVAGFSALFQQANVQGQTILAPGGDDGATDCDFGSVTAADGLAVDFPASSPYVTAVGGTMFADTVTPSPYWQSASGTTDVISSALGYIPETVWNEYTYFSSLAAGGGGASIYFTKPVWQVGTGVPSDQARDVPDIALNAGSGLDGYLYCVPIIPGVTTLASCTNGFRDSSGGLAVVGGTSAGVPSFAGILALVEQRIGATTGLGNINPVLYGLGGSAAFHDITTGNNNSPCISGAPDCQTANSIGFSASTGYDLATGWGSIDATNLANAWKTATPTGSATAFGSLGTVTTVSLPTGAPSCGISGGSITITVGVAAAVAPNAAATGAVPTGFVQMLIDGVLVGSPVGLTTGSATMTASTAGLSSGAHNVAAVYLGDPTFAPSKSYLGATVLANTLAPTTIIDIVSTTTPDFALTPCLPTVTVQSGATSTPVTLNVASFNGFSGPVTFSASTDSSLLATFNFSASSATVATSAPGTVTLSFSAFTPTATASAISGSGFKHVPPSGTAGLRHSGLLGTGAGTAALASILFLVLPRRKRMTGLLLAILSVSIVGLLGCGSGATPIVAGTAATTPTAAGTYLVNVTASGTNSAGQALVHTVILTLTVSN